LFDNYLLLNDIPAYIKLKSLDEAGIITKRAAALAGQSDILSVIDRSSLTKWQEGTINIATALNIEQQTKNSITGISRAMEEVIKDARVTDSITSNFYDTGYIKNTLNIIENYYSDILAEERESAYRYYTIANNDLGNSLSARREELERGRTLLNGLSRQREDGASVIEYFPTEAFNTLTTMLSVISGDLERGSSLLADYSRETASIITVDPVLSMFNTSRETINELNNIRTQGTAIVNTARSRMALAETYRQEGERLFREAQTAFQRQNFDTARERIQRASERYNNSLEIQESAALRQQWDNQLLELGQAIVNAENEMIIAEVRNLVNNARVTYFAGNFQQAENNLIRARNRWRLTNPEENDEVLYWLGIVRGAMSARSGRIIPPTAPLYPEMSQLLNEARRSYEEGTRLINAGSRSQGLTKFDEARQLTREVRLIFPVNQEAGILELRIEQFTDPAGFNATFEQRLRTAINGTRQRSMEAFADLQNLAEINPRYPRIAAILTQAEIDMGYRPPPPNPQDLTRSRELTASASRILEENITTLYEVALTQINEAITLNPENTDAARIKDRLLNRMSVPGAIVLTSQDEEEYQRAVRELQSGNNLVALAVVERLMQNPRNRNITKLIELQRRIQSVL
jgi:tetratricopeptide (TPR) repeat protein